MSHSKLFFIYALIIFTCSAHAVNFEKFDARIINNIVRQLTAEVKHETGIRKASSHIASLSLTSKEMYKKVHSTDNTNMLISAFTQQFMFTNELCAVNYLLQLAGAKMWLSEHMRELGIC